MIWILLAVSFSFWLAGRAERAPPRLIAALWTASALFLLPAGVKSQEVSYSVVPTYEEVRWNRAFGLERARLFGARVSLDFGPFFSLQPFYAWKDEVGVRDGLVSPAEVSDIFDVKAFGADVQVNLGRGSLVPFVRGGGGVLRTDDEIAGRRDRIFLRGGGGLRVGFGGSAGLELSAERWATRLAAPFIPGAVSGDDFPEDGIVNSTVFGAGLRLPFGGGSSATEGVSGILPGIFVEPYAARIEFDDELRLERQYLAGARAGVDLNQNVGLRAYYWRGVDDEFSEWMDVYGYGGEAQFLLNTGSGLSPFLVAGAGRIEFKDDFRDLDGAPRDRENHLILGGGAAFGLGDRARIELGARNFLMTVGGDLEDVTSPDELVSNWQYSAGVSVAFGARGRTAAQRAADVEGARDRDELARLTEENRRLRAGQDPSQVPVARADTVTTITVPVPAVGEIILRYGEAYAARGGLVAGDTTAARLQRELVEAQLREIIREELAQAGIEPSAAPPVAVVVAPAGADEPFLQDGRIHALVPFAGGQVSSPNQFVFGMRVDVGPISGPIPLTLLPELSIGVGDKTTVRGALNGRMGWNVGMGRNLTPYGQIGASITNHRFLSLDLAYGLTFDAFQSSSRGPFNLFVEHRGVALFDENQILVGISFPR